MNAGNNAKAAQAESHDAEANAAWGNVHSISRAERGPDVATLLAPDAELTSSPPRRPHAEYRIVRDRHCGYEVQYRRRFAWLRTPWLQCGLAGGMGTNSHASLEEARAFALSHASAGCVEYLGFL
ncbi:hypothetical protein [Lysobacter panacisoli]|uniref:WGR domain-containing protein n=1 Tax=Lysobacter panacisoli TaxID=1255263 RepID=A0ABP9L6L8_9GAMM|nr:hypothetical protein [Lysobacter panacisoli]